MKVAAAFLLYVSAVGSVEEFCSCIGFLFSGSARYEGFRNRYANPKGCNREGDSYCQKFCREEYPFRNFDASPGRFGDINLGNQLCRRVRNVNIGRYELFSQACDRPPVYAGVDGFSLLCCKRIWERCWYGTDMYG